MHFLSILHCCSIRASSVLSSEKLLKILTKSQSWLKFSIEKARLIYSYIKEERESAG